jgi:acyl dehydratase
MDRLAGLFLPADNRREGVGMKPIRYWDDLVAGEQLECRPFSLGLDEVMAFARTYDPQLFHIDHAVANTSRFGGIIASSLHTLSACTRAIVDALEGVDIIIGLGIMEVALPNAVYPGDLLTVSACWADLRRSASKPWQGLATVRFTVHNQRGETVMESGFKYMIGCRTGEPAVQNNR